MNIYIDIHNNVIILGKPATKKEAAFYYKMDFSFGLDTPTGKKRAIEKILANEELALLKNEQNNTLILSDETVGFGLFDLPKLSKFKTEDVFDTRFKMSYPNFGDYYVNKSEYSKTSDGVLYFYSFAKKKTVDEIVDIFSKNGVNIASINFFGDAYVKNLGSKSEFPEAHLFVGKDIIELILSKGSQVIGINIIDYGSDLLLNGEDYLDSGYFYNNNPAKRFAGLVKASIGTKEAISDINIAKTPAENGLKFSKPKELRILKDTSLSNYNKKNNARKLYSRICDIIETFSHANWYLPIKEINLYSSNELYDLLNEFASGEESLAFNWKVFDPVTFVQSQIVGNSLYKKTMKFERRRIDWAKLLTMEIGKKKA